ncbi:hypothetical protein GCM10022214_01620 [Actinomadura miaoliensis]|uniref:Uncharacterized protein n=1 Tax=Actinomadura miaoliensis TaxID=430685 RepID=A0ABP7UWL3_9ACTN
MAPCGTPQRRAPAGPEASEVEPDSEKEIPHAGGATLVASPTPSIEQARAERIASQATAPTACRDSCPGARDGLLEGCCNSGGDGAGEHGLHPDTEPANRGEHVREPDPATATTARPLLDLAATYRVWKREPPYRLMAERARHRYVPSTFNTLTKREPPPNVEALLASLRAAASTRQNVNIGARRGSASRSPNATGSRTHRRSQPAEQHVDDAHRTERRSAGDTLAHVQRQPHP